MKESNPPTSPALTPQPARNKGKLTGPKPPLRPGHVWSIRAKLQLERRVRDPALFNLAIDRNAERTMEALGEPTGVVVITD